MIQAIPTGAMTQSQFLVLPWEMRPSKRTSELQAYHSVFMPKAQSKIFLILNLSQEDGLAAYTFQKLRMS